MLNGIGEIQRILLLGGKSDLALAILEKLPTSEDAEVILFGRNIVTFTPPSFLSKFDVTRVEVEFREVEKSKLAVRDVFSNGDVDLVILAFATLGDEESQLDAALFEEVLRVNFYSQAIMLNEIYAQLSSQMHGQILVISSVAGERPRIRNFVYGASKSGIDFLARGLQKLSPENNVFITILRPGFVHTKLTTNMSPAPFATEKTDVARVASRALLKKKSVVYAPRILKLVMLVLRHLPERIFRFLDK